ncbi:MAG: efflux RND transporter periplasmic adaptor subunit, partial [Acidobacteria bacterium]
MTMKDHASADSAPTLTPVQLSPQRLQAIGVKTALVEMQVLNDELRVPGNVEVNEQQLSYVQTRFPGWIQKVFANATYQYVRKGQPLFTIYSPDLVSTEQEYLLAKQNQNAFAHDMHGTASHEGDWLLQAAADRLRQFDIPQREIANLEQGGKVQHDIEIDSPASGYITER